MIYVQWAFCLSCLCLSVWSHREVQTHLTDTSVTFPTIHKITSCARPGVWYAPLSAYTTEKLAMEQLAARIFLRIVWISFFSCPTCSFYVLVVQGRQSYHLLCLPSPLHSPCLPRPSHSCDPLAPSCYHLHYDCRCIGCCCGDPCLRGGHDLGRHGDPGPHGDLRHCADRSCRCGDGDCHRGAPSRPHVCPVSCLWAREGQLKGSSAGCLFGWGTRSSGCRRWWSQAWTWWRWGIVRSHWHAPSARSSGCQRWSSMKSYLTWRWVSEGHWSQPQSDSYTEPVRRGRLISD